MASSSIADTSLGNMSRAPGWRSKALCVLSCWQGEQTVLPHDGCLSAAKHGRHVHLSLG